MRRRRFAGKALGWLVAFGVLLPADALGARFGVYGVEPTQVADAVAASGPGHTTSGLAGLSAADLVGVDVLWVFATNNSAHDPALAANASSLASFAAGGGVVAFHDRRVVGADRFVPGGENILFARNFDDAENVDVLHGQSTVTAGPGGRIDDGTLDGGNSSNHGFAVAATLPSAAVRVFSRTEDEEVVDFYYTLGEGLVYFSTIPLDFYLGGAGLNGDVFRDRYAVNTAAFLAQPFQSGIPEPETALLFGLGLVVLLVGRRERGRGCAR